MKIQKRLPFGFRGDWGKLYKRYTEDEECTVDGDRVIEHEQNYYVDIGMDVQFKRVSDSSSAMEQAIKGLPGPVRYITVETTDAYWDDDFKCYECIVAVDDIVKVFNRVWIVKSIRETCKYTPARHSFYYCELESISECKVQLE